MIIRAIAHKRRPAGCYTREDEASEWTLKASSPREAQAEARHELAHTFGRPWRLHGFIVKADMFDVGRFVAPQDICRELVA